MSVLFKNIAILAGTHSPDTIRKGPLKGAALAHLPVIENAWLLTDDNTIRDFGPMSEMPPDIHAGQVIDASGRILMPAWCDSHTHLVFAASRESEFIDKIKGLSYAEIAAKGGGILNSANRLNAMPEEELYQLAKERLNKAIKLGTGAIEVKSGYGLTVEGELKMLRVIKRLKATSPIPVKASFLGAHTYPLAYRDNHEGYLQLIEEEMLPVIASENLADYIDVFCETGFFSPEETERICRAGMQYGLQPKIHANQLNLSKGVEIGVALNALSVDHLETMDDAAIQCLAGSDTIGTLLPTAAFFLGMAFQPARQLIDAGCAIALASDFNPGSSPSYNMNLVVAMSCIRMKMQPEEAINAATLNGAFAMDVGDITGSITRGKLANLVLTQPVPSLAFLPYSFGNNLIERVMIAGQFV
ncbi:imidazolonepropionase [Flavihumibacter stibioxidans]|uniref:Imidazolonepropionase n=1 Tax=Flavihumibacter stibioxidans TaxID=1834163 RepID=A0ABR7M3D5_9BACT|nr:imidazolonepropionase [Flavihumibacter stibioxidans]MBC6489529.1 imidazolonepropionase [Flavihumibacter stibioxidans]